MSRTVKGNLSTDQFEVWLSKPHNTSGGIDMERQKCICNHSYLVEIPMGEALRCLCGYYGNAWMLEMTEVGSKAYFTNRKMSGAERKRVLVGKKLGTVSQS